MNFARFTYGTIGLLTVSSLAGACSSKTNDCDANKTCGPFGGESGTGASGTSGEAGSGDVGGQSGESGEGGSIGKGGGGGSGGAPCSVGSSPAVAECVIGDGYGIFVSLSGDDESGDGTEGHPLATVSKALTLTGPSQVNRVYVCSTANGTTTSYAEPSTLVIPDRVSIYGGFTCERGVWSYDTTVKAYIKPKSPIGATITSAKTGVTLEDIRIDAESAPDDGTGASSFGMIVNASQGVVLTRVEVHAGKGGGGAKGADGAVGANGELPAVPQNGSAAQCGASAPASQEGGKSVPKKCGSQGGSGGNGFLAVGYSPLQDGASAFLVEPTNGGKGSDTAGQGGKSGTSGFSGSGGIVGAAAPPVGNFSATGFVVASGGDGTVGSPGFGGGGGGASLGSSTCVGASGGAGGMGGCGGGPGVGGRGGGASVALLSWASIVTIDGSELIASAGGAGGLGGNGNIGGLGKAGGIGGSGFLQQSIGKAGNGGDGGDGGNGANGAGGTGGPSVALVYSGRKPTIINGPRFEASNSSAPGGHGGRLGIQSDWAPDGANGSAQKELEQN